MILDTNKDRGRAGLALAIGFFGANGFTVNLPINDTQWYDMIVEKDGKFLTVQCKFTSTTDSRIDLSSTGGTNGGVYGHVFDHPVSLLFCANAEGNMYVIPVEDLRRANVQKSIALRTTPNANNQGFNTYQYQVKF